MTASDEDDLLAAELALGLLDATEAAAARQRLRHDAAFAHAHATVVVTNHSECCETENTTALDDFGDAVHRDHLLFQTVFWAVSLGISL
jgi:hypothetical protein